VAAARQHPFVEGAAEQADHLGPLRAADAFGVDRRLPSAGHDRERIPSPVIVEPNAETGLLHVSDSTESPSTTIGINQLLSESGCVC